VWISRERNHRIFPEKKKLKEEEDDCCGESTEFREKKRIEQLREEEGILVF
jgi:hypothetical protein